MAPTAASSGSSTRTASGATSGSSPRRPRPPTTRGRSPRSFWFPSASTACSGAYSDDRDAFTETDVELFRLLASTVESAFARTEREREIAQRNERLNEFASVVSHDLRNPLNVATGHVELARGVEDDEDHLDKIDESLHRMERLIEGLLARARGDRDLDREPVDLDTLAWEAWDGVDTCEDGFSVADDGPGIPADEREQVFERGVSRSEDGTGYGLSIVADIVKGHGWRIAATDSDEGGARFEITNVHSLNEQAEA